jgi:aromatic ring hydroxylase
MRPKANFEDDRKCEVSSNPDGRGAFLVDVRANEDGLMVDDDIFIPWDWILRALNAAVPSEKKIP